MDIQVYEVVCPVCHKGEVKHRDKHGRATALRIRAFKVTVNDVTWSHCLDCDVWFDIEGNVASE